MNYYALPVLFRIALMLSLFLLLCGNMCMLFLVCQRKPLLPKILITLCAVCGAGMMILFSADVRIEKYGMAPSAASRWLCEMPIGVVLIMVVAMSVFLAYAVVSEVRLRRATLTRSAIKESLDHLTTGLCFYAENGRILLVNHQMVRLCHAILGSDLQNAALMWEALSGGTLQSGVTRLSMGSQPSFLLPDQTVWTFSREALQGFFQITAANTTQLHELTEDMKQKNTALAALHLRLKNYEKNVEELSRSKEQLHTKSRIHSELGQALLTTRRYLMDSAGGQPAPLDAWKRSIAILRMDADGISEHSSLQMLIQTAHASGVSVEVVGKLPTHPEAADLFTEAAAEALTNAVRHADARTLYITFSETERCYLVRFQNDGHSPEGTVTEGGGLSNLRRKVETFGGTMRISCHPAYTLTISVTKQGGKGR